MTKMLSASGGLRPLTPDQGLCRWTPLGALPPDPRYRLVLRSRHGAPQPLTASAAYVYLSRNYKICYDSMSEDSVYCSTRNLVS